MNGEVAPNGDDLRKTAIIVLGAVLITSIISLTVTVAISGRGSEQAVQWITLGTVALAVVGAGPIIVLRPRHDRLERYRDRTDNSDTPDM